MKRTEMKSPHHAGAGKTEPIPVHNDGEADQNCFVCGKEVEAAWFCRLSHQGRRIVLCSPFCSIRFSETAHPAHGPRKL
jgi:hypothetical protein